MPFGEGITMTSRDKPATITMASLTSRHQRHTVNTSTSALTVRQPGSFEQLCYSGLKNFKQYKQYSEPLAVFSRSSCEPPRPSRSTSLP